MSMMDHEASMLLEQWYAVRKYIPKKDRVDAATDFLRAAEESMDLEQMSSELYGNDASIDTAMVQMELIDKEDNSWAEEVDEDNLGFDEDY
jgi:hypothetical protein